MRGTKQDLWAKKIFGVFCGQLLTRQNFLKCELVLLSYHFLNLCMLSKRSDVIRFGTLNFE